MTQEEFNEMFVVAMGNYGKAQENDEDVPPVTGADVAGTNANHYSMPLVRNQSGIMSYAKVPLGGDNGLIKAVADEVETTGMLEAMEESEFDAIFT